MAQFASNEDFFQFVRDSIMHLHTSGRSLAASRLSGGFRLVNGLTDGWADFLEAVQSVQAEFAHVLSSEEREALERIRAALHTLVYRQQ
jgi:hypothetical protein